MDAMMTFLVPVLSALVYAVIGFAANYVGPDPKEVDWAGLLATIVIGGVVGAAYVLGGVEVTQESVLAAITANMGVVYIVKKIVLAVIARLGTPPNPTP